MRELNVDTELLTLNVTPDEVKAKGYKYSDPFCTASPSPRSLNRSLAIHEYKMCAKEIKKPCAC